MTMTMMIMMKMTMMMTMAMAGTMDCMGTIIRCRYLHDGNEEVNSKVNIWLLQEYMGCLPGIILS